METYEYVDSLNRFKDCFDSSNEIEVIADLIDHFAPSTNLCWLDVGIGDGTYTKKLTSTLQKNMFTINVTGIDPDSSSLSQCQRNLSSANLKEVPFERFETEEKFDVINVCQSIYYFDSLERTINKIKDLLAHGGVVIFTAWNSRDELLSISEKIFGNQRKASDILNELRGKEWVSDLKTKEVDGSVYLEKWRNSMSCRQAALEILSRDSEIKNRHFSRLKSQLDSLPNKGTRSNTVVLARKQFDEEYLRDVQIEKELQKKFPSFSQKIHKLHGDEEAKYMASWEDETKYLDQRFSHDTVLDLCCGIGGRSVLLAQNNDVVGIDQNENRITAAKQNAKLMGVQAKTTFIRGDVTNLDLLKSLPENIDTIFIDPDWRESLSDPFRKHALNPLLTTPEISEILEKVRSIYPEPPISIKLSSKSKIEKMKALGNPIIEELWIRGRLMAYNVVLDPTVNKSKRKVVDLENESTVEAK